MAEPAALAEACAEPRRRREADFMGMFVFLGTETMLFGALFCLAFAYRTLHPGAAAEAAGHLRLWIATANTALLLTSSLFVALAVHAARNGARRAVIGWLLTAMALGLAFLGLKGIEYVLDYRDGLMPVIGNPAPVRSGPAALFLDLYLVATGLHAVHMSVGIGVLAWAALQARGRQPLGPSQTVKFEMCGLYWHFVDVVWVFVYPLFYLVRP